MGGTARQGPIKSKLNWGIFISMENEKLHAMRHTAAHVLAAAVQRLYPDAKFGVGPVIDNGFYYDVEFSTPISDEDLKKIQDEMKKIKKEKLKMIREELSIDEAIKLFTDLKQDFKVELLKDLKEKGTTKINPEEEGDIDLDNPDVASIYKTGDFIDLCRGPHVENVKEIGAFKLLKLAGAYWRGDEKNKMLTRIYGVSFETKDDLADYLTMLEEARKRDHRKLGTELDLFSIHHETVGAGLVHWHPKGGRIRSVIEDFWRGRHFKSGYDLIYTPHIGKANLWQTSGHLDFYQEGMYSPLDIDGQEYYVKPMNCPFHVQIYKTQIRSYRDLPLRWAELGTVYRYEKSGVVQGLLRVRGFTQDDAHIICTPEQVEDEIQSVLRFSLQMLHDFGFEDISAYLSTRPEKSVGEEERWVKATRSLEKALKAENLEYAEDAGGGAFYGPKIDLKIKDSIGREWQLSTIQFDFNLPERFDMVYIAEDGEEHRPYMVHRALLGSLERFFGILIEHYAGAFPMWLSPEQVRVVSVGADYIEYANKITEQLRAVNLRVSLDSSKEKVGKKIRNAAMEKIPWTIVIGEKEMNGEDIKVNVFGQDEDLEIPQSELVQQAVTAARMPSGGEEG